MKAVFITLAIIAGFIGFIAVSYISAYNSGNALERALEASYENNRNILAQYGNKVAEAGQIPAMQRDDLTKVVTAALEGRYGEDGSQAVFQWIQESNPQIDSAVYIQLQRLIEAGRNDFAMAQQKMIDQKRVYETKLGSFWSGTWMHIAGYPKIDLAKFRIVSTSRADEAFTLGQEEPINLRGN